MGIISKKVEVKPSGKMIQYYKDLGYDVEWHKPLMVKIEDLPKNSHAKISVQCDICKCNKIITYKNYNESLKNYDYYTCNKCSLVKQKETLKTLYGVDNIFQSQECKDKIKATFRDRYNRDNPMQVQELKEKQQNSLMEHFGVKTPLQNKEIKQRAKNTTFDRYGFYYASQSDEFKEVVANTMLKKYGSKYMMQCTEFKEKANRTLCENGNIKTSKQQLYLHNLYGGELNYPISYYAADICFPDEKLVLEYDGKGHELRVTLGKLTQEEFDRKEIIRSSVLKREGYKTMRIISKTDKLPSDSTLLQMLQYARNYFSQYPIHSWIEFNLDTSSIHSAEYKDGVFFDYGELKPITNKTKENNIA